MQGKITSSVQAITPERAAELLAKNVHNRPLNRITVEDYKAQMLKGLWKINGEPIIIDKDGNLLDGQHRLKAVFESNITIPAIVVEGIDASTFTTIDTGRVRTAADIFNIEEITDPTNKSAAIMVYYNLMKNGTSAATRANQRRLRISKGEVLSFYRTNKDLVDNVVVLARKCRQKIKFMTISELAGMALYLILEKHHEMSLVESFFSELHGLVPVTNKTVSVLYDTLIKGLLGQKTLTPVLRKVYIIKTWNAYVKGKELKGLVYNRDREGFINFI